MSERVFHLVQVVRQYPAVIPLLMLLALYVAAFALLHWLGRWGVSMRCPSATCSKGICWYACETVARQLSDVDDDLRRYEWR